MVEFNGRITGKAEKHYFKSSTQIGLLIIVVSGVGVLFPLILFSFINGYTRLGLYCCFGLIVWFLIPLIPKTKKQKLSLTPKKIYTDGESITCISDAFVESRMIGDEKEVVDYGEFYAIVYPFGKLSDKFICQKSLLTKGSLEEFEKIFEEKIKRK